MLKLLKDNIKNNKVSVSSVITIDDVLSQYNVVSKTNFDSNQKSKLVESLKDCGVVSDFTDDQLEKVIKMLKSFEYEDVKPYLIHTLDNLDKNFTGDYSVSLMMNHISKSKKFLNEFKDDLTKIKKENFW